MRSRFNKELIKTDIGSEIDIDDDISQIEYGVLPLKDMAIRYENDYYGAEEDWDKRLVEEEFYAHLRALIGRGHVVNIQVNGEVSSGKSTVAIALMMWVNNIMQQKGLLNPKYINNYNLLIYSDNTEFWKKSSDLSFEESPGVWRGVCVEIDEENKMIRTGANSTVEMTSYEHKSDVFAQKFVHRIYCTPSGLTDQNTSIILWCEPAQKEYGFTDCKVKFRNVETGRTVVLGRIRVDVRKLMKLEMYQKYKDKKFARMNLFEKNGIKDYRDFTDAEIIMYTYKRLYAKSKFEKIPETKVRSMLSIILAKRAVMFSFLGSDEVIVKVKVMLDLVRDIEIAKDKIKGFTGVIDDSTIDKVSVLRNALENDELDLKEMEEFYINRIKIKKEYDDCMGQFEEDPDEYKNEDFISEKLNEIIEEVNV